MKKALPMMAALFISVFISFFVSVLYDKIVTSDGILLTFFAFYCHLLQMDFRTIMH